MNFLKLIDLKINSLEKTLVLYQRYKTYFLDTLINKNNSPLEKMSNIIRITSSKNKNNENLLVLSINNKLGFISQNDQFDNHKVASEDTSNYKIVEKDDFAYNPARRDASEDAVIWKNFHSGDNAQDRRRAQDYKLRKALRDTVYWGSFITDLYSGIIETNSDKARQRITSEDKVNAIEKIKSIRNVLGGNAVIVAIGNKAFRDMYKPLHETGIPLKKIKHYASFINQDIYRNEVIKALSEE